MNFSMQRVGLATVVCGLALGAAATPAWAQKSGGTSSGGGGGGGGSTAPLVQTVPVMLVGYYYGVGSGSTGSATLTFDSTQTVRGMSVTASNVNLPDGTQLHVDLSSNAVFQPTAYYPIWATQAAASITLVGHNASESISTADGLSVPLFGTAGQIVITAYTAYGARLGIVMYGNYSFVQGNKPGGHP